MQERGSGREQEHGRGLEHERVHEPWTEGGSGMGQVLGGEGVFHETCSEMFKVTERVQESGRGRSLGGYKSLGGE